LTGFVLATKFDFYPKSIPFLGIESILGQTEWNIIFSLFLLLALAEFYVIARPEYLTLQSAAQRLLKLTQVEELDKWRKDSETLDRLGDAEPVTHNDQNALRAVMARAYERMGGFPKQEQAEQYFRALALAAADHKTLVSCLRSLSQRTYFDYWTALLIGTAGFLIGVVNFAT